MAHASYRGNITGGIILVVLGVLFLIGNLVPDFEFGKYWPVILIAIGIGLLLDRRQHNSQGEAQ